MQNVDLDLTAASMRRPRGLDLHAFSSFPFFFHMLYLFLPCAHPSLPRIIQLRWCQGHLLRHCSRPRPPLTWASFPLDPVRAPLPPLPLWFQWLTVILLLHPLPSAQLAYSVALLSVVSTVTIASLLIFSNTPTKSAAMKTSQPSKHLTLPPLCGLCLWQ